VIALEGVEKTYRALSGERRRVLGPLALEVRPGQRLAVVGPSGCGKSTLVRMILGLVRPDRGHIVVDGETLDDRSKRAIRQRVGYVVQEGGLFPHLTAERNVTLVARHLRWGEARIEARVAILAEMTGLDRSTLGRWPLELSGGQRQRVGLMRALMLDPAVLLMDEPLGALDPVTRRRLQRELLSLFRSMTKTVMIVTHDIEEAAYLAEEAVVLREGAIVQRGTIDEMARAPTDAFVRDLLSGEAPAQVPS
jgi:osmoprotectant transport system ATP-binding protein